MVWLDGRFQCIIMTRIKLSVDYLSFPFLGRTELSKRDLDLLVLTRVKPKPVLSRHAGGHRLRTGRKGRAAGCR